LLENKTLYNPAKLFTFAFIVLLISVALVGIFFGNTAIDFQMHDTYFVIGYFHILLLFAIIMGLYAVFYRMISIVFGINFNKPFSKIHFWITTICMFLIANPIQFFFVSGTPRRYYSFNSFDSFQGSGIINKIFLLAIVILILTQFIFAFNLIYSIFRGDRK